MVKLPVTVGSPIDVSPGHIRPILDQVGDRAGPAQVPFPAPAAAIRYGTTTLANTAPLGIIRIIRTSKAIEGITVIWITNYLGFC